MSSFNLTDEYRDEIASQSMQDFRGYKIPISALHKDDLKDLYTQLTIHPLQNYVKAAAEAPVVAYRRNSTHIFLPMSFGFRRYGFPHATNMKCTERIAEHLVFDPNILIRPEQKEVIDAYLAHVNKSYLEFGEWNETTGDFDVSMILNFGDGGVVQLPCGAGKTIIIIKLLSVLRIPMCMVVTNNGLVTQAREQLEKCLPGVRIGLVQGDIYDVEDKDVVICMLQTVYKMKQFSNYFKQRYGFLVLDEAHRMVSSEYCAAMNNISAQYRLAVSATLDNRTDGLELLLDMYMGPTLVSKKRDGKGDDLIVHAITFEHKDEKFNRTELDENGQMSYSAMLSKLSYFQPRIYFIMRIVLDIIQEFPETPEVRKQLDSIVSVPVRAPQRKKKAPCAGEKRAREVDSDDECSNKKSKLCDGEASDNMHVKSVKKRARPTIGDTPPSKKTKTNHPVDKSGYIGETHIIIFGVQKDLLIQLYELLRKNNVSVGMFVGGMSEEELATSVRCQVILATYSMAAEGLDIPTLSVWIAATPRSEIEQSVGRILRRKNKKMVIDIVDKHAVFRAQFKKRRVFYDRCNYPIINVPFKHYSKTVFKADCTTDKMELVESDEEEHLEDAECCF